MPKHPDDEIERAYREKMNRIMTVLDQAFNGDAKGVNRDVGLILLMFPFGEKEGCCNYISNGADRKDIVTMFRELIRRLEGAPETKGTA